MTEKPITVFAPAKINLFLHITGKRKDGYHNLDSLVVFCDIGDTITITPSSTFQFSMTGPFAKTLSHEPEADNIVVKAAQSLSQITQNPLNLSITLQKNIPVAAGLGGGSADAAAILWGLQKYWDLDPTPNYLPPLMGKLGADVPVCYHARSAFMRGVGDELAFCEDLPEMPVVLVNPNVACSTKDIFLKTEDDFLKPHKDLPRSMAVPQLLNFLSKTENSLYNPAVKTVPEIENVMHALMIQDECLFHRMSGSGATCFGLFEHIESAQNAADNVRAENPDWWVQAGMINNIQRY